MMLAQAAGGGGSPLLIIMVGFAVVMYVMMRSQKKRQQAQQQLQRGAEVGDEIMTTSGIFGTIVDEDEEQDTVRLEIAPGTTITILRAAISRRITEDEYEEYDEDDAGEDEDPGDEDHDAAADAPAEDQSHP